MCRRIFIFVAFFASLCAYGLPFDLVGNASKLGYAQVDKVVFKTNAKDPSIQFKLQFFSDPKVAPGIFGPFWRITYINSGVRVYDKGKMLWEAPDGKTYYFFKNRFQSRSFMEKPQNRAKMKKYDTYFDTTGKWVAMQGDTLVKIESLKDESHYFIYKNSCLFKFAAKGEVFTVSYSKSNRIVSLKSNMNQSPLLEFSYDKDNVRAIRSGSEQYEFTYHADAVLDLPSEEGRNKSKFLASISYPDGTVEKFRYESGRPKKRVMVLKDLSEKPTSVIPVCRVIFKAKDKDDFFIEWCKKTGMIISDSSGEYRIGNDYSDAYNPDYQPTRNSPSYTAVKYVGFSRKYPEFYYYDRAKLVEIMSEGDSGKFVRNTLVGAYGGAYLKVRKAEEMDAGGSLVSNSQWKLVKTRHYNDKGTLIREIYGDGSIKSINYIPIPGNGMRKEVLVDGILKASETYSNGKLTEEAYYRPNGDKEVYKYFREDGINTLEKYVNDKFVNQKKFSGGWSSINLISSKSPDGTVSYYKFKGSVREELIRYPDGREKLVLYDDESKSFYDSFESDEINNWKKMITSKIL